MLVAFAAAEIAPWVQGASAPSVVDEEVGETAEVVDAVELGVALPVVVVVGDAEGVLEHPPRTNRGQDETHDHPACGTSRADPRRVCRDPHGIEKCTAPESLVSDCSSVLECGGGR